MPPSLGTIRPDYIHQGPGNFWMNLQVPGPVGPLAGPTLTQSSSGALTATTYYAKLTYVYSNGVESGGSPETNLAVSANNVLNVASPPAAPGVSGYNVYVSNTAGGGSGAETKQNTSAIAIGTPWVEPGTGLIVGVAPLPSRLLIDSNGTPLSGAIWVASKLYLNGQQIIDSNGNTQRALTSGITGSTVPAVWGAVAGAQTIDGGVIWTCVEVGAIYYGGAVEAAITTNFGAKTEPITADQIVGPVDSVIVGADATMEVDMKETDMLKVAQYFAGGIFNQGTDVGLPAGLQNFKEISFGGLMAVPKMSIACISPRRNYGGKFVVAQLYMAYQMQPVGIAVSKEKVTTIKMKFTGLFDSSRPQGDQAGRVYWQD